MLRIGELGWICHKLVNELCKVYMESLYVKNIAILHKYFSYYS